MILIPRAICVLPISCIRGVKVCFHLIVFTPIFLSSASPDKSFRVGKQIWPIIEEEWLLMRK